MFSLSMTRAVLGAAAALACMSASALPIVTGSNQYRDVSFTSISAGTVYLLERSFTLLAGTTGFSATVQEAVLPTRRDATLTGWITGPGLYNQAMTLSNTAAGQRLRLDEATMAAGDYTLHFSGRARQSVTPTISVSVVTPMSVPVVAPPTVSPIPEPETYAMFLAGLAALGFLARRRGSV